MLSSHCYRLGILKPDVDITSLVATDVYGFERGKKFFELSNHLGNVLVSITDRKNGVAQSIDTTLVDYYLADVASASDYYPFGMTMPGRSSHSDKYRYGFNGKEKDDDLHSLTAYDYGFRIYNPALGRFLSVDPLMKGYPELSSYQFASNSPILNIDLDGLESFNAFKYAQIKSGKASGTSTSASVSNSTPKHAGVDFSGAKIEKMPYVTTGAGKFFDLLANGKAIGANTGANLWNGTVQLAEDGSNLVFSSEGRKAVLDRYYQGAMNLMIQGSTVVYKIQSGEMIGRGNVCDSRLFYHAGRHRSCINIFNRIIYWTDLSGIYGKASRKSKNFVAGGIKQLQKSS